jgi:hypothetical protein
VVDRNFEKGGIAAVVLLICSNSGFR